MCTYCTFPFMIHLRRFSLICCSFVYVLVWLKPKKVAHRRMTNPSFKRNAFFCCFDQPFQWHRIQINWFGIQSGKFRLLLCVSFFSVPTINYQLFPLCHCRASAHVFLLLLSKFCLSTSHILVVSSKNSVHTAKMWNTHITFEKKIPLGHLSGIHSIHFTNRRIYKRLKIEVITQHEFWSCLAYANHYMSCYFVLPFVLVFLLFLYLLLFRFFVLFGAILKSLWFAPTY